MIQPGDPSQPENGHDEQREGDGTDATKMRLLDKVCRQFDEAWRDNGHDPVLDEFLSDVDPELRSEVFPDLIAIDWERRTKAGEEPKIESYRIRFAQWSDQLDDAFVQGLSDTDEDGDAEVETPDQVGEYRIVREVGRGGMGIVFAARQESLNRMVAIKVLPHAAIWSDKALKRFQREAEANARLRHPHIVPVFGVGQDQGMHYFVMDLVEGVSLSPFAPRKQRCSVGWASSLSRQRKNRQSGSLSHGRCIRGRRP